MESRWDEAERLEMLRHYNIVGSPHTADFADFVQIAAQVCETPVAVVNFIDDARQWFAAEIGLGVRETPLDVSICAHAIRQPGVFVVPDLTQDPRFACNPLVTGRPKLRFYGGALLETSQGLPLGTVCVLDYAARPDGLTEPQIFTLQALARQVMTQLELRRSVAEKELLMQEAHHRIKNSLQTVQSLLRLHAKATTYPEVAQQLREGAARINTFGAMHERLYQAGGGARLNLATYLKDLLKDQEAALTSVLSTRAITFIGTPIFWPTSDAASVGLIMTELVTNALKHGEGSITVTLRRISNEIVLTVEDEGNKLPLTHGPTRNKGFGMRIIDGLLRGRRGQLKVDRSRGHTCFVVTLKTSP